MHLNINYCGLHRSERVCPNEGIIIEIYISSFNITNKMCVFRKRTSTFTSKMLKNFPNNFTIIQPDCFRKRIFKTHALSLFLPLARRRLITLRPPGVAIRARNPCFFLRRRLLGWKVRFIA